MPSDKEYEKAIRKLKWAGLRKLWGDLETNQLDTWWKDGRCFEYLVVRMFELDRAKVTWPYSVNLFDKGVTEQIDGSVRFDGMYYLLEAKDRAEAISIDPVAKMRNQLLRRPSGTIGLVFTTSYFAAPTVLLGHFTLPQAILLWTGKEVEHALRAEKICDFAKEKYRACVEQGVVDFDITVL
jgi:hypothetical protein